MENKWVKKILKIIFCLSSAITIYPLLWLFLNSLKNTGEILTGNSFGLPKVLTFKGYVTSVIDYNILKYFFNSVMVTVCTILLTVVLSTMLAYSLARMNWKLKGAALNYVLLGVLLPSQIVIVPVFMIIRAVGLVNSPLSLILTVSAFTLAMSTLIAYGFLRGIPKEMEEAAVMDGCGLLKLFFTIILPIIKPAVATMGINIFIHSWNEFLYALILISKDSVRTLPIALMSFVGRYGTDWTSIFAAMVIASIIPVVIFLIFSSQVEKALTAGAILK